MRRQKYLVARDEENVRFAKRFEVGERALATLLKIASALRLDLEQGYMMIRSHSGGTRYQ